jgi:hypothetical protein
MDWIHDFTVAAVVLIALWFWKPWAASYAGEKGKNLARKEDLDSILTEVKGVTRETEAIKAELQSVLADRERQMRWRIDVYMDALAAITQMTNALGRLGNMDIPDSEILDPLTVESGRVAKIQIVASNATIAATQQYIEAWTISLCDISSRKILLRAKLVGLDEVSAALERLDLLQYCAGAAFDLDQRLIDAAISARNDLELPFDSDLYSAQTKEMMARLRKSTTTTFDNFRRILSEQIADQG